MINATVSNLEVFTGNRKASLNINGYNIYIYCNIATIVDIKKDLKADLPAFELFSLMNGDESPLSRLEWITTKEQ